MPLSNTKIMFERAEAGSFAVGAFNVENMEMAQAVIEAAEELKAPVIIQSTPGTLKYAIPELYQSMTNILAEKAAVPVAMHLDHGESVEMCQKVLNAGYTSLMIDGSKLDYEANIQLVKQVVDLARQNKSRISVEAELGALGGKEDDHHVSDDMILYTDPQQAKDFVQRTGIDSLAVAIGTAHGFYKGTPKLDFERLKAINQAVSIPLVLHGASGLSDQAIKTAIELGVRKINFATELRNAYTQAVKSVLTDDKVYDPKIYGRAGKEAVKELVKKKIILCGSHNRF